MTETVITLKVKKKVLKEMTLDLGEIADANDIIRTIILAGNASFKEIINELYKESKLINKTEKKINEIDKQLDEYYAKEKRLLAKDKMIQDEIDALREKQKSKLRKRDRLYDRAKSNGYRSRKVK